MPNRLSPELIAVSNGVVYPFNSVVDAENPNRIIHTTSIATGAFSGTVTVYYIFQGSGVGTYSWSSTGTFEFAVKVYEISSSGWPCAAEPNSNQTQSFIWTKGQDGSVYKLELGHALVSNNWDGTVNSPVYGVRLVSSSVEQQRYSLEIDSLSDSFSSDQKKELVVSGEISGAVVELSGKADKNNLGETVSSVSKVVSVTEDSGLLRVVQVEGALDETPPLFLYSSASLITRVERKEAYARWVEKVEGSFVPQRANNGRISFTNSEPLSAGVYRLVLDAGNIGEVDSAFEGFNVNVSLGNTTVPATLVSSPRFSTEPSMRFAFAGDLGYGSEADSNNKVKEVSDLVKRLKVNDFFAVGDLDYDNAASFAALDLNIGSFYHDLMYPYNGTYGSGSPDNTNRFWACPGNHDWGNAVNPDGLQHWHQLFEGMFPVDPDDNTKVMRYFDVLRGDCHFFLLSTDTNEDPANNPDGAGRTPDSKQGQWLKAALKKSTARWKVVVMHHPPLASELGKESTEFKWPFKEWGANLIIGGHAHNYERFDWNGLPIIIVGTGGYSIRNIPLTRRSDTYSATSTSGNPLLSTSSSAVLKTGMPIVFTTAPGNITADRIYFLRSVSSTTFKVYQTELDARRDTNALIPNTSTSLAKFDVYDSRIESLVGIDHRNGTDPSAFGVLVLETTPSRLSCRFINIDNVVRDEFELNAAREETEVEFKLSESVSGNWTLQLDWTNDQDFSDQGFSRNLAIYSYVLEKVQSNLYKVSIDPYQDSDTPLVEELSTSRLEHGDPVSFGTWIARYNSLGTVVDYFNELTVFPQNENYASPAPLAGLLTGVTELKQDDVHLSSTSVVTGADPYIEVDPSDTQEPSVTISYPADTYKVGDEVVFTATSATPDLTYVWTFWDGTSAYSSTNTITKKLSRGGTTPLQVSVSVTTKEGVVGYASSTILVNAPPVIDLLQVTVNDQKFPYETTLKVHAYDPEGTSVNIKWVLKGSDPEESIDAGNISAGDSTAKSTDLTVENSETWTLVATDTDGAVFEFDVDLRGEASLAPVISAQATPTVERIGPSTVINFKGVAVDQSYRESEVTYNYEWTFWDGQVVSGVMDKTGDFTYEALPVATGYNRSLAGQTPGRKLVVFKVTENGTDLVSTAQLYVTLALNNPPVIESITSDAPTGAVAGTTVNFSAKATDPDGDPLSYKWNFTSPELLVVNAPTASIITSSDRTHAVVTTAQTVTATLPDVTQNSPIKPGSLAVEFLNGRAVDNGLGVINSNGSFSGGTVNYSTGVVVLNSTATAASGELSFSISYTLSRNDIRGTLTVTDPYGGQAVSVIPSVLVAHGLVITSALAVDAVVLLDFSYKITANAPGPFTYTATSLPAGLTLNPDTGTIGGRPGEIGNFSSTIKVVSKADPTLTDTKILRINVASTRSARPPAPTNLEAFNDGQNPTYSDSTTSIPIRWTIARDQYDATAEIPSTILEIRNLADDLKFSFEVTAGINTYEIGISDLISYLGGKTTFVIYVYHYRSGLRSAGYDKLTVLKV